MKTCNANITYGLDNTKCPNKHHGRGLCRKHYDQTYRRKSSLKKIKEQQS